MLIIGFLFLGIGIVYGFFSKTFKKFDQVVSGLVDGFKKIVPALILFLVMTQFMAALNQSNIGLVSGYFLGIGLSNLSNPILVLLLFILMVAFLNLMIASLTSKWAVLGPIFLIALAKAGIHPAAVVGAYRIGDSATNLIAPLMPYFALILIWAKKWVHKDQVDQFQIGSLMSIMFPYSVCFLLAGGIVVLTWVAAGTNLGIDGPVYIEESTQNGQFWLSNYALINQSPIFEFNLPIFIR